MTVLVPTYNDVLQAVRTSKCVTHKKRNRPKARVGIYGETFQDAVARLAAKLRAKFRVVMQLVIDLQARHKLNYVSKRLVAASDHDRSSISKRLPVVPVHAEENYVDPELMRWPEYLGQQNVPAGDLFRQAIWGSDTVPIIEHDWQARSRSDVMSDHPSSMAQHLSVA